MKNIFLTIVTENQHHKILAEKLASLLQIELGGDWEIQHIEKYNKFEDSYKIELTRRFSGIQNTEITHFAISLSNKLVSPWLVYFDDDENSIELIFNKNENTRSRKMEFNAIKWGQLQITK